MALTLRQVINHLGIHVDHKSLQHIAMDPSLDF